MTRRDRTILGIILATALALRVAWCVYAARPPGPGLHDPGFYRFYGEQLAHFDGYRLPDGSPTAYYPPGYSLSLAPFFWVLYNTPLPDDIETGVIAALNITWQLVTICLAYVVARRLAGPAAGVGAAIALALWPNLIFHTAVAMSESLFLLALMVVVALAVAAPWDRPWERWRLVVVGGVLGVGTLVRPVTVPMFAVVFVALVVARLPWRRALGHTAIVTAVAVAVVAPWIVRNAVVMDSVTLSTNTGDNLCMSRRLGGSGGFELENPRCFEGPFTALDRPEFETGRDAHGRRVAAEFVRDHPAEELRLVVRRVGHLFGNDADGLDAVETYGTDRFLESGTRSALHAVATSYGAIAGVAGVAGLVLLVRRRGAVGWFVALTGLGMLLPPLVFFGDARFHVPAVPVAAVGVGCLAVALARHRGEQLVTDP